MNYQNATPRLKKFFYFAIKSLLKTVAAIINFNFFLGYRMGGVKTKFKYFFSFAYIIGGVGLYYIIYIFFSDLGVIMEKFLSLRDLLPILFVIEAMQYSIGFFTSLLVYHKIVIPKSVNIWYAIFYIVALTFIPIKSYFFTSHTLMSLMSEVTLSLENATDDEKAMINYYFSKKAGI